MEKKQAVKKEKREKTERKVPDFVAEWERQWAALEASDQVARKLGKVVGRYVSFPYADGAAIYLVVKTTKKTAVLKHVAVGDAWHFPMVEEMGCRIPLHIVVNNINRRDGWKAMIAGKKKTVPVMGED